MLQQTFIHLYYLKQLKNEITIQETCTCLKQNL